MEVVKADTDSQLSERGDLLRLLVDIESERARLSAAEQEIKQQRSPYSRRRVFQTPKRLSGDKGSRKRTSPRERKVWSTPSIST